MSTHTVYVSLHVFLHHEATLYPRSFLNIENQSCIKPYDLKEYIQVNPCNNGQPASGPSQAQVLTFIHAMDPSGCQRVVANNPYI